MAIYFSSWASTLHAVASSNPFISRKRTLQELQPSVPPRNHNRVLPLSTWVISRYVRRNDPQFLQRVMSHGKNDRQHSVVLWIQGNQLSKDGAESKSSWWNELHSRRDKRQNIVMNIAATMFVLSLWAVPSAYATDTFRTCACLLKDCRGELARCIADPACAANVACLQTCNDRPDETECQIGCGNLFENSVVDQFNECAVSRKKCVPQKPDDMNFPIPLPSALISTFNTLDFNGKWFISSGLNPTFDTFDCQLHEFFSSPGKLTGKLTWRIRTPDDGFFTRSAVQNFVQDSKLPGILYNHGNEFLHYQDDWYILSAKTQAKPDDYIFIYYKGKNDAWDGYGGAIVYTRSKTLPPSIVPELKEAAKKVGLDFEKFRTTDNTCGPEPPLFARLEKKVEEGEQVLAREVQDIEEKVEEVGKTEMNLLQMLGRSVREIEQNQEKFLQDLSDEEKELLNGLQMEAKEVEKLFGKALPIRKLR